MKVQGAVKLGVAPKMPDQAEIDRLVAAKHAELEG